ncbi:MAG: GGDEF domain-containing protein [Parashewanella sp.]
MDFGLASEFQAEGFAYVPPINIKSRISPNFTEILQLMHSTLKPSGVFNQFGKVLEQYLPITGIELPLNQHHLSWGLNQGKTFKRHIQVNKQSSEIVYRLAMALSPKQLSLLQKIEQLLIQPLENALKFAEVSQQAMFDPLTSLGNRRYFQQMIESNIARCNRGTDQLSLVVLDLDNFKQLNDKFGHQLGDTILCEFGGLLRKLIRNSDQAFRIGGDEFIILAHGDSKAASILCQRILTELSHNALLKQFDVMTSIGIAEHTADLDAESLYQLADKALYLAKAKGKNQLQVA